MTAPNHVAALVERLRKAQGRLLNGGPYMRLADAMTAGVVLTEAASALEAAEDKIATQATAIAALQAEVERAKEDERDRLFEKAQRHALGLPKFDRHAPSQAALWLQSEEGAMLPAARSASRKENTP